MSDFISGIKSVPPAYPVKPVQPSSKDRGAEKREKDKSKSDSETDGRKEDGQRDDGDRGDNPAIDEYV